MYIFAENCKESPEIKQSDWSWNCFRATVGLSLYWPDQQISRLWHFARKRMKLSRSVLALVLSVIREEVSC